MKEANNELKLGAQLCFYLYAASRAVTRYYHPYIEKMGLTYPQWLTMMVLWEESEINVKSLGERLFLDSGTLTPMLKRLEEKGFINRRRSPEDERKLMLTLTPAGEKLKEDIYLEMESYRPISQEDGDKVLEVLRYGLEQLTVKLEERDGK